MTVSVPLPMPHTLINAAGLRIQLLSHGALRRIGLGALNINLFIGNELEGGPANLWLRGRDEHGALHLTPLLGPLSPLAVVPPAAGEAADHRRFTLRGRWLGLDITLQWRLAEAEPAWFWHLQVHNASGAERVLVPILVQDVGLADAGALRQNEYYVSHYLDLQPLAHPLHGQVLAVRQNQPQAGRHPWLVAASLRRAERFATDGLQVWAPDARMGAVPAALRDGLPSVRLQHEHALVALEDAPLPVAPGQTVAAGFAFGLQAHHPAPSGPDDLGWVDRLRQMPEALADLSASHRPAGGAGAAPASPIAPDADMPTPASASLFALAPLRGGDDLDDATLAALFGGDWRHVERAGDGTLLSFFHGDDAAHVVLAAKEARVQRPHGHLLRSGLHRVPDEAALTSTCWMGGVFHSMLTQGHVSINRLLGTQRSWLGLFRSHGLRLFVQDEAGAWALLGTPSAFEMAASSCRWVYRLGERLFEVVARAGDAPDSQSLEWRVRQGAPLVLRATLQLALDGDDGLAAPGDQGNGHGAPHGGVRWTMSDDGRLRLPVLPGSPLAARFAHGAFSIAAVGGTAIVRAGDDGLLYDDGRSRGEALLCLDLAPAGAGGLELRGELVPPAPVASGPLPLPRWDTAAAADGAALAPLRDMLPWLRHNALVHYLSPRGLEQFSGGGWGTRDVCQGPLELLLALGELATVRDLLLRVFAAQSPDGDWPQWFMFFDRERDIRAGDSHGDIVFWPLLGLAQYLLASADASLLDEPLPFHGEAPQPLSVHVARALALIRRRRVPGTPLAAYWHGDWNDSLQPADPALRERLCSAWTVTLHHQTLQGLSQAMARLGDTAAAQDLADEAAEVQQAFQRLLVADDVVTGYAHFPAEGGRELWIHPADRRTGLRFSLLPMMHAVLAGMLSPEQAQRQAGLIARHLKGPDGARLFDAPLPYRGGLARLFQRAETSSFFGREIGIMYMHAHLRHAQMLAHLGQAEAFFEALDQSHPVALAQRVPSSSLRQANCYYSSSDAAFHDRYEAARDYHRVAAGQVALDGGWRVYSSGPGIALGLVIGHLLGVRLEAGALLLDPVMPARFDGLRVELPLAGQRLQLAYHLGARGCGVTRVLVDGREQAFDRRPNPYRVGAAAIAWTPADGGLTLDVFTD